MPNYLTLGRLYTELYMSALLMYFSATSVPLRVEGEHGTIFEGRVSAGPRNVTTASGGTHLCDGTNDGANPLPGGTDTTALDKASSSCGFTYDGTYDASFQDYFITSIGDTTQTSTQFWGLLSNLVFTARRGCQTEVSSNAETLWAFDAFNAESFLKLDALTSTTVPAGGSVTFAVGGSDGSGDVAPAAGAAVGGQTTSNQGVATVSFPNVGFYSLKAERSGSIRSNAVIVTVTP